ncbi:DUF6285 domain-containing protein [Actinomadura rugatobispora]|uniref:DUF6285 domain-containing protein n=1 Tax=Actinomadura rugatobispora TaxID=1994 RepID=A0ABW1AFZ3_9ACTN|nr:hypothetical protein GCM10010200_105060 [Actinomadura rugatobispora]
MAQPHDAPSARELVEAVREFLERDVLGALEGRTRFHALVAVNALSIVEREMAEGPAQAERHRARLEALGYADDAALAAAIRAGETDGRHAEVKAALTEAVRDKLLVANPRHLAT